MDLIKRGDIGQFAIFVNIQDGSNDLVEQQHGPYKSHTFKKMISWLPLLFVLSEFSRLLPNSYETCNAKIQVISNILYSRSGH